MKKFSDDFEEDWSRHLSWKISLTFLSAIVGGILALYALGVIR